MGKALNRMMHRKKDASLSYEDEKRIGIRKSNGARKLKRLSKKHKDIVFLHLDGWKSCNIADVMNSTDAYISMVLNDPLAQDIIKAAHAQVDCEFNALYAKVVDTIRDGLDEKKTPSASVRLRSVDRFIKLKQVNGDQEQGPETAEDVIQRLLAHPLAQVNIQVNGNAEIKAIPHMNEE